MRAIRRLWPLLPPVVVLLCALFAAQSASHVFASNYLDDENQAKPSPRPALARQEPSPQPSKDSELLRSRNMFCSECVPGPVQRPDHERTPGTRLPLRLIATNISSERAYSFATVLNVDSQRQGAYQVGQHIPEAGIVRSIAATYLEVERLDTSGLERIDFESGNTKLAAQPAAHAMGAQSSAESLVESYVRIVDETHFEIDRDLVAKLKGDARLAGAMARAASQNGAMTGIRLFAVKPSGLAHAMGLRNGDTLVAANGIKLSSLEASLELLGQLQQRDHWSFDIERRGKALQLQVELK